MTKCPQKLQELSTAEELQNQAVSSIKAYARSVINSINTVITNQASSMNVGYAYDALGRLATVTNVTAGPVLTKYGYDNAGNLTLTTLPQHSRITNSFDARNRLTRIEIGKDNWSLVRRYDYGLTA